ncbi:uncharacterized protein FTJAE_4825 [Fusarium tjaetaba]|uniref:Uncharacterized protein n=1 Tax=Fusarium tjaetaba TaxID=1567544 RepID=A0A8H5RW32_9HYPO|nr:uncharacterized protein FTJAE_4825 [Fusarium tjaetaba]KAF5639487.1 hypothetical protein FTJAE_4825 [Fusarium tjaetaba]
MPATRPQKRKAEESESQNQTTVSTGRPTKIVLLRNGKRAKVARDDDDQVTVPAPPATVYRHSKLKKLVIRNTSSANQSMYPMVRPVVFRGVQAQEPEEKPVAFTSRCDFRPKCLDTTQSGMPTQKLAPGAVHKKRIAPTLVKAG